MEVEIISKECIKPSSPTPHHLRTHKLSFLDQFTPSTYVPMVLYYPIDDKDHAPNQVDIEKILQLLKQSLSQTLSRFYPFAGQIKDNLSIDCNDEGAYYVEARVKANLSEFLSHPDLSLIHHLLPGDACWKESTVGTKVAMVQVSVFDCGGITIGVYISHMVGDGISMSTFLKNWGATARGCCDGDLTPDFNTSPTRFPQNDSFSKDSSMMALLHPFVKKGKAVTRRFVFDASALSKLKAKSTSSRVQNPTRVEVVSALIWKCNTAALKAKFGFQKPSLLGHAVNLRRREVPPLSEYVMGNLLGSAFAECTAETDTELVSLVNVLREAIAKINDEYLKNLETDRGFFNLCEFSKEKCESFSNKGAECFLFSSWCHFGFYEVDFGWGKPMWASCAGPRGEETSMHPNSVILMENKWGDGIEAWVTLVQQDMDILECNEELLAFASLNPNTLQVSNLA